MRTHTKRHSSRISKWFPAAIFGLLAVFPCGHVYAQAPGDPTVLGVFNSSISVAYGLVGADGYVVEASTGALPNEFAGNKSSSTSDALNTLAPQDLYPNTTYYLRAGALWGASTSYADVSPPSTATLANLVTGTQVYGVWTTSVTVNWVPLPTEPFSDTAEGYTLEASTEPDFIPLWGSSNIEKAQELFGEGMRQYSSRQLEKAVQAFQKSLEFDPTNEWAKKSLEITLKEQNLEVQIQNLKQQLEEARRQKPVEPLQTNQEPSASRVVQNPEVQIQDLKQQIEKARQQKSAETFPAKPGFSKISMNIEKAQELFREGMRQYSSRQLEKAVQAFQKSLEFDPTNEWAKKSLERTLKELEQEKVQQKPAPKPQGIRYMTRKGDTLRSLAKAFYGDPGKWTIIRDANPKIKDQQKIPMRTIIIIPEIPEIPVPVPENKP